MAKTGGNLAGTMAFVTCPRHLPTIWPILLTLTARTTLGAWLKHNAITATLISTLIFIGGIILASKWIGESNLVQS
jgi:hypothetical protein